MSLQSATREIALKSEDGICAVLGAARLALHFEGSFVEFALHVEAGSPGGSFCSRDTSERRGNEYRERDQWKAQLLHLTCSLEMGLIASEPTSLVRSGTSHGR